RSNRLLTRSEIEAEYGLTRRYLELAAWRGDGPPFIRISRRQVRYRVSDLEAWLAARTEGGEAA
ncbi:MAG: helix-turn-helix domain-containing protein, partial [Pseudomonadota bacterium]